MSPPTTEAAGAVAPGTTPAPGRTWRRRRLIVDPRFQFELIARATTHTLLALVVVSAGLFGPVLGDQLSGGGHGDITDTAIVLLYMHGRFWWVAAACLLIALLDSVRMSHRIAGPLVPLRRNLVALGKGKLPTTLRTRGHDYLQEEVATFNQAVAGLAARIEAVAGAQAQVVAELRQCQAAFETGDDTSSRAALATTRQRVGEVTALLAQFERVDARAPVEVATAAAPVLCQP